MNNFLISVDIKEISERLGKAKELLIDTVKLAVENLSTSAHAFIVNKANTELTDFQRQAFLGIGDQGKKTTKTSSKDPRIDATVKNVRWVKLSDGLWVVEIDDSADWIEKGRARTFMGEDWWLLNPSSKGVKKAKDGSTYRVIPMTKMKGNKPTFNTGILGEGPAAIIKQQISKAARSQGINLKKIESNEQGLPIAGAKDPKTGLQGPTVLHKLDIQDPKGGRAAHGLFYSKARSSDEAKAIGLKPYAGAFHAQGAVVTQRETSKGKFTKETVVFRVISSKHRGEGRWYYPEVKPFNSIQAAYEYATKEWEKIVKSIEESM